MNMISVYDFRDETPAQVSLKKRNSGRYFSFAIILCIIGGSIWYFVYKDKANPIISSSTSSSTSLNPLAFLNYGSTNIAVPKSSSTDLTQGTKTNLINGDKVANQPVSATSTSTPYQQSTTMTSQIPEYKAVTDADLEKLQFVTLTEGSGEGAIEGSKLTMKYAGFLKDGTVFDASYTRPAPQDVFKFTLGGGQVIKGWDQGLIGIKVGERRQLLIPADYGYGARGQGPIPPNSPLIFVVDCVAIQ
jgi:peptidylprolyl isomerase